MASPPRATGISRIVPPLPDAGESGTSLAPKSTVWDSISDSPVPLPTDAYATLTLELALL